MSGISAQKGFIYQKAAFIYYALCKNYFKEIAYENDDDITIEDDNVIYFIQAKDYNKNFSNSLMIGIIDNWIKFNSNELYKNKIKKYILILKGKSSINKDKLKEKYISKTTHDIIEQFEIKENHSFDVLKQKSIEYLKILQKNKKVNINDKILEKQYKTLCDEISSKIDDTIKKENSYRITIRNFDWIVANISNNISEELYDIKIRKEMKEIKLSDRLISKLKKTNRAYKQLLSVFPQHQDKIMKFLACSILYNDFRNIYEDKYEYKIDNWEYEGIWNYEETMEDTSITSSNKLFDETLKKILNIEFVKSSKIYSDGCYIYLTEDFIDKEKQITWDIYEK